MILLHIMYWAKYHGGDTVKKLNMTKVSAVGRFTRIHLVFKKIKHSYLIFTEFKKLNSFKYYMA